jgi:hypothetical protein
MQLETANAPASTFSAADRVLKIVRNCAKSQQWLPSARSISCSVRDGRE